MYNKVLKYNCILNNNFIKKLAQERKALIEVTKMDAQKILINENIIETVEETPDTIITLTTGRKLIVMESRQEIQNLVKLNSQKCIL